MGLMGRKPAEREWDEWLTAIQADGINLTAWEESFVEDMAVRREADRTLSEKQSEILERIYAQRTP